MADPKLSIIICTYNRAGLLDRTLDSLSFQDLEKDLWQVIVVDNNSSDKTKEIVTKWQREFSITYVFEPNQGLSISRNTGINAAYSDFLLFLDDDIYAVPGMLRAYYDYLENHSRDPFACLAGKVVVEWEGGNQPPWFPSKFLNLYGQFDLGNQIIDSRIALGGNMLWNRSTLLSLGGFDINLGRKGNLKLASEETTLVQEALKKNHKILYIPDAVVRHWTPYTRQTKSYLFNLCYWLGISKSIAEYNDLSTMHPKEVIINTLRLIRDIGRIIFRFVLDFFKKPNLLTNPESVYLFGRFLLSIGNLKHNAFRSFSRYHFSI